MVELVEMVAKHIISEVHCLEMHLAIYY